MKAKQDLTDRTFALALRIVKLALAMEKRGDTARTLVRQVLRSGTSIGANVEESQAAVSRKEFRQKLAIGLKEARETRYWLRLMTAAGLMPEKRLASLIKESDEVSRILGAIVSRLREEKRTETHKVRARRRR